MLPPGLQMLLLLWFLLWTPKLGLPSPLSLGDMMTGSAQADMPTLHNGAQDGVCEESTKEQPEREPVYYPKDIATVLMVGNNNGKPGDLGHCSAGERCMKFLVQETNRGSIIHWGTGNPLEMWTGDGEPSGQDLRGHVRWIQGRRCE